MKSIYLSLFVFFTVTCCHAQRIVDLQLVSTQFSLNVATVHPINSADVLYYNGTTHHYFIWTVKNNGPDSLIPGDTLHIRSTGWNSSVAFDSNMYLKKDSAISIFPITAIGNTIHPWITLPIPTWPQTPPQFWKDSIWVTTGPLNTSVTDPYPADNADSIPVIAFMKFPASVKAIQDAVPVIYPNPAVGKLNIEFPFAGSANAVSIVLKDIMGKHVYQESFENVPGGQRHTIDITPFPSGIYFVELNYNGKQIVNRVNIK